MFAWNLSNTYHAPSVPSGTILMGPASACFFGCTFVIAGILPQEPFVMVVTKILYSLTYSPWVAASNSIRDLSTSQNLAYEIQ